MLDMKTQEIKEACERTLLSVLVHNRGTSSIEIHVNIIAFGGYPGSKESEGFLILTSLAQEIMNGISRTFGEMRYMEHSLYCTDKVQCNCITSFRLDFGRM